MIIIPSSQFLKIEIQNEVGCLPPTFSFLQNKRLYEFQVKLLKKSWPNERIIISLPKLFEIPETDLQKLNDLKVDIFQDNSSNKLGKHINNIISNYKPKKLKILHGDTFFNKLPPGKDIIVIGKPIESAEWHMTQLTKEQDYVWAGFFNFSNPNLFSELLEKKDFSFEDSIEEMCKLITIKNYKTNDWFDFGHLEGFHKSRQKYTTERSFNNLNIDKYQVEKSSRNKEKIQDEFNWFNSLPIHLKKFSPNVYGFQEENSFSSYKMNYINGFSLSELMLFSKLGKRQWKTILNEVNLVIAEQKRDLPRNSENLSKNFINEIIDNKNIDRVNIIYESKFIDRRNDIFLDNHNLGNLDEIVSFLNNIVYDFESIPSFSHGDLCFSNIIYRARGNTISLIDPRGVKLNELPIGDQRYDLAKLCHSICWGYDRVISGEIIYDKDGNSFHAPKKFFKNRNQEIIKDLIHSDEELEILLRKDIQALTALLFISMIPLHEDSQKRQASLLGTGLQIFMDLKH